MPLSKSQAIFWVQGILLGCPWLLAPQVFAHPILGSGEPPSSDSPAVVDSASCSLSSSTPLSLEESAPIAIAPTVPEEGTETTAVAHHNPCVTDLVKENPSPAIAQGNSQEGSVNTDNTDNPSPSSEEFLVQEENTPWRFSIMPYATIPVNVYGTNVVRGNEVNYSAGLGTLLQYLQIAVSGRAEAWQGNFGLIADGYYASLAGTGFQQYTRPLGLRATLVSNLTFIQGIYDFALTYHFGETPAAFNPKQPSNREFPLLWFEPILGTRLNQVDSTIKTTLSFDRIPLVLEDSVSKGRTWFEPLIGGKIGLQVSDPLTLWLRGDASGFGLAGQTDISWNIFFGADWWVNRSLSLSLSYRFYEIDYGNGTGDNAFRFNESFNGPTIAATFHF